MSRASRMRLLSLHADVETADDVSVETWSGTPQAEPEAEPRVVLRFSARGEVDGLSLRMSPAVAHRVGSLLLAEAAAVTGGAR
ncbi:hypothetical protein [Cellulomonas iranensis]|uniref:hypothetical protein n=1 Tax=Cellulomonas iranensis TaxID=76862 RepID=UPI000B3D0E84|nr:hypothetical protein [Cellulomonas iranensis]